MQLVIEKAFLDDFFLLEPNSDAFWYEDFLRFLTNKAKDFVLLTDFENRPALFEAFDENPIWEKLSENWENDIYDDTLNANIENGAFYQSGSIFKIFCTTKSDSECKALEEKYGYIYLNINTLKNKWAVYQSDRDDASLPIDTTSNPRFDDWENIQAFRHPIRSMIISDLYLLDNSYNPITGKDQPLDKNLYPLLKNLLNDVAMYYPLELFLLVKKSSIDTQNNIPFLPDYPDNKLQKIGNEIERFFRTEFSNLTVNLTIAHYTGSLQPNEKEHDRGIYTNYFFFEIGAGINLFNSNNDLRNRSTFNSHFLLKLPGKNIAFSGLRSFKEYIQNVATTHGVSSVDYFYNFNGNHKLLDDSCL